MASGPASVPLRILDSEFDILLTKVINLVNYDAMISKPEARNQGSRDVMDKLQSLFVRYNVLINELGKSVRFSTGQRLEYIEELVEAMVGRLIELKNAMVDTSEWLFQYFQKIETMERVDYGSSFMAIPEALKSRIQKQREKLDNVMTISGDWEFIDSSDDDMEIKDMERIVANHEFSRQRREDAFKYLNDYASSLDDSAIEFLQEAILKSLIYRNDVNLSEPSKKELTSKDIEKSEVSENEMTGKLDNPSSDYLQKYISLNNSLIQWMFESRALTGAFPAFPEEGMRALMKDISTLELMDIIEKPVKPKKEKGAKKEAKMKTDVTTNKYSANLVRINELTKEFKLKSAKKPEIADDWMKITESNDLNADVQFMDLVNANMSDQVNILQRAIDGSAKYPFKEVTAGKNIKPRPKKKRNINQRTVKGIMAELLDFGLIEYPLEFTLDDVKGVRQPMPSLELESGLA